MRDDNRECMEKNTEDESLTIRRSKPRLHSQISVKEQCKKDCNVRFIIWNSDLTIRKVKYAANIRVYAHMLNCYLGSIEIG